jgi:hypothetical protein
MTEVPNPKVIEKSDKPNIPKTTEGIPEEYCLL